MRTGQYDGVSASGDATLRLIAGGDVAPVNVDLIPNYANVFEDLKDQPYNTVDGVPYGIPHGRGANLLMWNTDDVKPAPDDAGTSSSTRDSPVRRARSPSYDNPIYIADAALYLKTTQPDLGITNPYELDEEQFDAAVDLLKQQQTNVGEYWSRRTRSRSSRSRAATASSARPGSTRSTCCRARRSRCPSRRSCRRRARPAGRTPG